MSYSTSAFFDLKHSTITELDNGSIVLRFDSSSASVSFHFKTIDAAQALVNSMTNALTVHRQGKEVTA